ncbi:MAG TPA: MarR family transcriptional regulator [Geminicoccaceae bacterium]|nr:MarR family transcriptional regulator [Geminicoccaceae bacterium]
MTEPKVARSLPFGAPNPLFLRDEELTRGIELLEQAHRALIVQPERGSTSMALGRNHWRVLYSIGRHPGITMVELQGAVPLTKQSLWRLLKELVAKGLIARTQSQRDRRQRPLELTPAGRELDERLNERLRRQLASAYRAAGAEAVAGYHKVLLGLVDDARRQRRRVK